MIFIKFLDLFKMKDKDKIRLQKFAVHLAKLREEKGLSQRALSSRCEVDFGKISKIENSKANLVVTTLIELADGLGVHPRELLNIDFD
jgi:transcriptional regulator with XRE-family HTH domain